VDLEIDGELRFATAASATGKCALRIPSTDMNAKLCSPKSLVRPFALDPHQHPNT
jgi:hypothetical protein